MHLRGSLAAFITFFLAFIHTSMALECNDDSSCNVGEYCGLSNAGNAICMPCGKCSYYKRENGSTVCPKSGHDCGPCLEGLQLEDQTQGGQFPKCRPIPGYKPPTGSVGMGAEDILTRSVEWYENPVFIYVIIAIASIVLIGVVIGVSYKCWKNKVEANNFYKDLETGAERPTAPLLDRQQPFNPDCPPVQPALIWTGPGPINSNHELEHNQQAVPFNRPRDSYLNNHIDEERSNDESDIFIGNPDAESPVRPESPAESVNSNQSTATIPSCWNPTGSTQASDLPTVQEVEEEGASDMDPSSDDENEDDENEDDENEDDENNNSNTFSIELRMVQNEQVYLATSDESGLATDAAASIRLADSMNGSLSSDITRDSAYCVNQMDSTPNSLGNTPVQFRRQVSTRSHSALDLSNVQSAQAMMPLDLRVEPRESNKRARSETATSQVSRRPRLTADQQETQV